jgi:two-component system chemotaxis response regulator CheY
MAINKKFLIVDDSNTMRQLIIMTLKKLGCSSIIDAPNGAVALEKLASSPVDIVFTDIDMPEMNGLEFIQKARPMYSALPIVILSTHGNDEMRDKGIALGANHYLTKPLSGSAVTDVLEQIFPDLDL